MKILNAPINFCNQTITTNALEKKLLKSLIGKKVIDFVDDAIAQGYVRGATRYDYLQRLTRLFTLGTCLGESYGVTITWAQSKIDATKSLQKIARTCHIIALQALDNLRSDLRIAENQSKISHLSSSVTTSTDTMSVLLSKITTLKEQTTLSSDEKRQYTTYVHEYRSLKKLEKIQKDPDFFLPPTLSDDKQRKVREFANKVYETLQTFLIEETKAHFNAEETLDAKDKTTASAQLESLLKEDKRTFVQISLISDVMNHKVVIFSGKEPMIYDSHKGLCLFENKEDAIKGITEKYFGSQASLANTHKVKLKSYQIA